MRAVAEFEITGWDQATYDEPPEGPPASRAMVRKAFRGAIEGESTAELLMARGDDGEGYVALERVSGAVDGRRGTFVLQHGAARGSGVETASFGVVVPGSGTGELAGLRGTVQFQHDDAGARIALEYVL